MDFRGMTNCIVCLSQVEKSRAKTGKEKDNSFVNSELRFLQNRNKQNTDRLTDTENRLMAAREEVAWGTAGTGEGTEKHRLAVTKWSWGCQVQHRQYSQ